MAEEVPIMIKLSYKDKAHFLFLPILFVVSILWFYKLGFHTMMGDDLVRWFQVSEFKSLFRCFSYILDGTKYRPVNDLCHYVLFKLFSSDQKLFFYFNILFNFSLVIALYTVIRKITNNNAIIAFLMSILYVTSRFSYYSILQAYGIIESFSLLLLILCIYCVGGFIQTGKDRYVISMNIFYLLIIFTHERYLVLLPFLLLVVALFYSSKSLYKKGIAFLVTLTPFLLNLFLKKLVFKVPFAQRTGTIPLDLDIFSISKKMGLGFLKVVGINNGPAYLNLVSFSDQNITMKASSIIIAFLLVLFFLLAIVQYVTLHSSEKKKEGKLFFLWITLFSSLLFVASIALDQEQRWLYSAFVVLLFYLSHIFSKIVLSKVQTAKHLILGGMFLLTIYNDISYKELLPNLYFVRANTISDSLYDETIKRYGDDIIDYEMYIKKFRDYEWILQDSLFLKPHIRNDKYNNYKIRYIDDVTHIDPLVKNKDKTLVFVLDIEKQKFINIKEAKPLVLIKYGPTDIKAGQIFNKQPSGESAIWAETENVPPTAIFVLNGVHLESAVHSDGKAASAVVPKSLYEKPGTYTLYLLDKNTDNKSNQMIFTVKP